jgi:hypothetical protein
MQTKRWQHRSACSSQGLQACGCIAKHQPDDFGKAGVPLPVSVLQRCTTRHVASAQVQLNNKWKITALQWAPNSSAALPIILHVLV